MKIDFQFGKTLQTENFEETGIYEIDFSIIGTTFLSSADVITAAQPGGSMEHIKQKVLTEFVALLQLELYGKVLSNEGENKCKKSD